MKRLLLLFVLCLVPALAQAQPLPTPLKLHGYPGYDAYTDASQFPTIAGHMNWAAGENPIADQTGSDGVLDIVAGRLGNSVLGHGHLVWNKCPTYAEIAGPISCRFSVVLFNVQAQAFVDPQSQDGLRNIVWDETGTSQSPALIGALGVERTWSGTVVIDPSIARFYPTSHGWWNPALTCVFRFANGTIINKVVYNSFFVMLDPAAPETAGVPFVSARVDPNEKRHDENWGSQIIETLRGTVQYLPLLPLKPGDKFRTVFATGGYGAVGLPPAIAERRDDAKIHEHVAGIVREEITQNGNIEIHSVFDADAMGPGTHPVIIGRRQVGLFGDQAVVAQLVFNVKVEGAATTPPPPPPPPVLVWQPVTLGAFNVTFEKELDQTSGLATGRLRACIGTECLVFKP